MLVCALRSLSFCDWFLLSLLLLVVVVVVVVVVMVMQGTSHRQH